jgi:type II secretory pathway predicted ATPase ExeA
MLPALPRLPDLEGLIGRKQYFVLHAPRQSGKTTVMKAAVDSLNEGGQYYTLYCSLEELHRITDVDKAMSRLIGNIFDAFETSNVEALRQAAQMPFWTTETNSQGFIASPLRVRLRELSKALDKELIIFFDEADCLTEEPLLSVLSQLRKGYVDRSKETPFPRSIALIGMRNIRDYKINIRPDSESLGSSSPFNIITEALTLANFTQDQVRDLYAQHTQATSQIFDEKAVQRAWYWSEGQPWLVNALAYQVINKILKFDYSPTITADDIDKAADNLMRQRDTHIDSLLARLHEPRVKKIIEPMLACSHESVFKSAQKYPSLNDDLQYCLDLGLIKHDSKLRPSNPIYASVISRFLNDNLKETLPSELIGKWMDGQRLDLTGLLKEFQKFWAERAERYLQGMLYLEAAPHSLLTAFLQRVVNGGAIVIEEYADGLGYADIVIKYAGQNYVIELKIKDNQDSWAASFRQLLAYMEPLLVKEGWLVVFDRKSDKSWAQKISWKTETMKTGETIHVVNC